MKEEGKIFQIIHSKSLCLRNQSVKDTLGANLICAKGMRRNEDNL